MKRKIEIRGSKKLSDHDRYINVKKASSGASNKSPLMNKRNKTPPSKEPYIDINWKQGEVRRMSKENPLYDDQGNEVTGDKVKILKINGRRADILNMRTRRVTRNFPLALLSAFKFPGDN